MTFAILGWMLSVLVVLWAIWGGSLWLRADIYGHWMERTMSDLPTCPTCGNTVELFLRETLWSGSAQIRCVGHHHIGFGYSLGSKQSAREELLSRWQELADKVKQGGSDE